MQAGPGIRAAQFAPRCYMWCEHVVCYMWCVWAGGNIPALITHRTCPSQPSSLSAAASPPSRSNCAVPSSLPPPPPLLPCCVHAESCRTSSPSCRSSRSGGGGNEAGVPTLTQSILLSRGGGTCICLSDSKHRGGRGSPSEGREAITEKDLTTLWAPPQTTVRNHHPQCISR